MTVLEGRAPPPGRAVITVGVISDTHGLLRDEAIAELEGSDVIVHAGDVGGEEILRRLSRIAPVHAVRGNTDGGAWGSTLPHTEVVSVGGADLYMVHDIEDLDLDPAAAGFAAVIYGHSHRPHIARRDEVLFINPGAAGHRRFRLPVSVGRLTVSASGAVEAEIVELDVPV